ncbi:MAG: four helix bundle protein [Cyclobacteriaceae bacterium]|nr:MAG: four helix bundle protein [Cyclobacteriaceae bacterium]
MSKFRFQDLEIWKRSVNLTDSLFDLADKLEEEKQFRFAEQLRGASLSISNNIAEGSGSLSIRDFGRFLNIAHRSAFEVANMLFILNKRKLITNKQMQHELEEIDEISRMIQGFIRSLYKKENGQ